MPKLKTHSGAKKRFSLTKSGKVKRAHATSVTCSTVTTRTPSAREASAPALMRTRPTSPPSSA